VSSSNSTRYPQLGVEAGGDTPKVLPPHGISLQVSEATAAWRALAPLIAGRPVVRESLNGGRAYPIRGQRALTERLPSVPAAVPVYSASGDTRVLVLDLDTSKADRAAVRRDAAAIGSLVQGAGGRLVSDESPSGGIHLYVPLAQPVPFEEARDFALALVARTPTLDPQPMLGMTDGLIRPPGSRHRSGGFQQLHGSLSAAHLIFKQPNPPAVWVALKEALAAEMAAVRADRLERDTAATTGTGPDAPFVPRSGGPRDLAADYLRIATTGLYNSARYPTPSHARQAVIASAVWAGLQLTDVIGRLHNGNWPGLASFYTRYRSPGARRKAVLSDWRNAVSWVQKAKANDTGVRHVRISPTSEPATHRRLGTTVQSQQERSTAVEYQFVREWRTALELTERGRYRGRTGPAVRMVLRALGEAAMKSGSRYIAFGTRSLDVASGMDHTTVAAHLRMLRDAPEPRVYLIENDRGLLGDLYELRIPDSVAARASRLDWRAGKIHALRPVFRDLGLPAAFVYEALERAKSRPSSFELSAETGMARSTVYQALETLAAFNLVEQRGGGWSIVAATSLAVLAESLGCTADMQSRIAAHRIERVAFRRVMRVVDRHLETMVPAEVLLQAGSEGETALELLERILGARRLAS
jgi:hypothetical protein